MTRLWLNLSVAQHDHMRYMGLSIRVQNHFLIRPATGYKAVDKYEQESRSLNARIRRMCCILVTD